MWSEVNKKREFCILGTRFFSLRNREIKLEHLLDNFLSEGVDLDILVCMVSSDLKRTIARQQL